MYDGMMTILLRRWPIALIGLASQVDYAAPLQLNGNR
jgi:hypothetical protein